MVKPESHQVGTKSGQVLKLETEHLEVPAGIQGYAVVSEDKLAMLQLGQSTQDNNRDFIETQEASGGESAMACDDVSFRTN